MEIADDILLQGAGGLQMDWGLLGPEQLAGSRRTRTLGLGAAVRKFNQLAVPGLGGVWFAKQLVLATLGVIVAERLRQTSRNVKTLEVANAVEALACWGAFESNGWRRDARLRGVQKLAGKVGLTFAKLRQSRFYVTQPMRMATVEALVDLGFVHPGSTRFNSFRCTESGRDLVEAATSEYRPYRLTVEDCLVRLAIESAPITVTRDLQRALSPIEPLAPVARDLVRSRLCEGAGANQDAARRKNGLAWVASIHPEKPARWKARPPTIDVDHWNDLRRGALFFQARDIAIDLLIEIEIAVARTNAQAMASSAAAEIPAIQKHLGKLRNSAQRFLDEEDDPTEARIATSFCRECIVADPAQIISNLVTRDRRVLQLRNNNIVPGSAFVGRPQAEDAEEDAAGPGTENVSRIPLPEGISSRVQNLYLFELDLNDRLGTFLNPLADEETA
ncbi:hypothetical protein [Bradyrhizobium sp. SZCCHNRI3052]|uniref:hypothetical protein n=1 Tax=Bradyrhizobium sp. SZCCHNRI3052 TaxID=3057295 RepID=UPI0029166E77|nr:hypothetical protein [Bradyrhizobium sp. SZCCHNRI3052]